MMHSVKQLMVLLVAFSAGVFATDVFQNVSYETSGISDPCKESMRGYEASTDYRDGYDSYRDTSFDCLTVDITTVASLFGAQSNRRGYRSPCEEGLREFRQVCRRNDGNVCFIQFDATVSATLAPVFSLTFGLAFADCVPDTCGKADYDEFAALLDLELGVELNNLAGGQIDVEFDFRFFCEIEEEDEDGNKRQRPNKYGPGLQTSIEAEVDVDIVIDFEPDYKCRCRGCSPSWEVEIDIGVDIEVEAGEGVQRRTWAGYALELSNQLSRDDDFVDSGCISNYNSIEETLDIVCPEGTGDIEFTEGDADYMNFIEFVSPTEGNSLSLVGEQTAFDTPVTTGTGGTTDEVDGASTTTPLASFTVVACAVALAFQL